MSHWSCIVKRFKVLRKEWEKETSEESNLRMQAYDKQKMLEETCELMTCPRCRRQVYELDETGLCLVCIGKEEEC